MVKSEPTTPSTTPETPIADGQGNGSAPRSRPKTSDATARRLIFAGIGVKAPKRSEEDVRRREEELEKRREQREERERRGVVGEWSATCEKGRV